MKTLIIVVVIVLVLLVVLALVAAAAKRRRSEKLRGTFGDEEYDRTVGSSGKRRDAERELRDRKDQREQLALRPLSEPARQRYLTSWAGTQSRFVDDPDAALGEADRLVTQLMEERGYPTGDFDRQAGLLSVDHGRVVEDYRAAHDVERLSRSNEATTEQVRNAMLDFRRVFEDLVAVDGQDHDQHDQHQHDQHDQHQHDQHDQHDRGGSGRPAETDPAAGDRPAGREQA